MRELKKDVVKRCRELFWECEKLEKFKRENEPKIGALMVDLFEARQEIYRLNQLLKEFNERSPLPTLQQETRDANSQI